MRVILIAAFTLIGTGITQANDTMLIKDLTMPIEKVEYITYGAAEDWQPFDCEQARQINNDRVCLACNIYHEARSEPIPGQYAVAFVTHNRVQSHLYPNDICGVVWEIRIHYKTKRPTAMFSWTLDGKPDKVYNQSKWQDAYTIANNILTTIEVGAELFDITKGALYYHANYVNPVWAQKKVKTAIIGNHIFYTNPPQLALTE